MLRFFRTSGLALLLGLGAGGLFLLNTLQQAQAYGTYLTQAESKYPTIVNTIVDSCTLCHTNVPSLNTYGTAYLSSGHNFAAIENLDSDGDGYTNLAEINAHTFPGDSTSQPAAAPTPTQTRMPTATATSTQTPVPTATRTRTATATATMTRMPTATSVPPTATRVLPSPTATTAPPIATNTVVPPTATPVVLPTITSTRPAPTATATRQPAPTRTPASSRSIEYRGIIRTLPTTDSRIGDWVVGSRTVHVTLSTRIGGIGEEGALRTGLVALVQGTLVPDGSISARNIVVLRQGEARAENRRRIAREEED